MTLEKMMKEQDQNKEARQNEREVRKRKIQKKRKKKMKEGDERLNLNFQMKYGSDESSDEDYNL